MASPLVAKRKPPSVRLRFMHRKRMKKASMHLSSKQNIEPVGASFFFKFLYQVASVDPLVAVPFPVILPSKKKFALQNSFLRSRSATYYSPCSRYILKRAPLLVNSSSTLGHLHLRSMAISPFQSPQPCTLPKKTCSPPWSKGMLREESCPLHLTPPKKSET